MVNVLAWHAHGSWMTNFVQGPHRYLVPVVPDRGPDGRGRAETFVWPDSVVERTPEELATEPIDVVVVQSARELELAEEWLGARRPGTDLPLIWLEHNAPQGLVNEMVHPARDRDDVTVVHVTHTNALFWDCGRTRTAVIEHGVVDPGGQWTGELPAAAVVVNEARRRARVTGTDLLPHFGTAARIDVFGMGAEQLRAVHPCAPWLGVTVALDHAELHREMARRRCNVHPFRWTSLGLSLIESMLLGMPVVALATTEVPRTVTPDCGVVSNDVSELVDAIRSLMADPVMAADMGAAARERALEHHSLTRFLNQWNQLLEVVQR